jgi:hypothetical protein
MKTTRCGNKFCDNNSAKVGAVCGNFVSATDEDCDYVNYDSSRCIYSLSLRFVSSDLTEKLKREIKDLEEVVVDLKGLESVNDAPAFLHQTPEAEEYGELVVEYLANLLLSWGKTFGIASELNPDPTKSEGPRFASIELSVNGKSLSIEIVIEIHLSSHQYDMLEWYPDSLAESLMDDDDFIWQHEGKQITLSEVEAS